MDFITKQEQYFNKENVRSEFPKDRKKTSKKTKISKKPVRYQALVSDTLEKVVSKPKKLPHGDEENSYTPIKKPIPWTKINPNRR